MGWRRLGQIFVPDGSRPWARSHAALPTPLHLHDDVFRVFFSSRDADRRSHIGWVDVEVSDMPRVVAMADEPVLSPGDDGAFDDSGVSIGCIVVVDGRLRLYYMGWNLGIRSPWRNAIGMAEANSPNGPFTRYSPGPMLDRSPQDPYTLSYPFVLRGSQTDWRMWYGSNLSAAVGNADMSHTVKFAHSVDGLQWHRDGAAVIGFMTPQEYAIARPSVIATGSQLVMAFACRGESYRIALATSADGRIWNRLDNSARLATSSSGWDSEMTCYPGLFQHRDRLWMAYNGNGYGATGFGLAVWEGALSVARST